MLDLKHYSTDYLHFLANSSHICDQFITKIRNSIEYKKFLPKNKLNFFIMASGEGINSALQPFSILLAIMDITTLGLAAISAFVSILGVVSLIFGVALFWRTHHKQNKDSKKIKTQWEVACCQSIIMQELLFRQQQKLLRITNRAIRASTIPLPPLKKINTKSHTIKAIGSGLTLGSTLFIGIFALISSIIFAMGLMSVVCLFTNPITIGVALCIATFCGCCYGYQSYKHTTQLSFCRHLVEQKQEQVNLLKFDYEQNQKLLDTLKKYPGKLTESKKRITPVFSYEPLFSKINDLLKPSLNETRHNSSHQNF